MNTIGNFVETAMGNQLVSMRNKEDLIEAFTLVAEIVAERYGIPFREGKDIYDRAMQDIDPEGDISIYGFSFSDGGEAGPTLSIVFWNQESPFALESSGLAHCFTYSFEDGFAVHGYGRYQLIDNIVRRVDI